MKASTVCDFFQIGLLEDTFDTSGTKRKAFPFLLESSSVHHFRSKEAPKESLQCKVELNVGSLSRSVSPVCACVRDAIHARARTCRQISAHSCLRHFASEPLKGQRPDST
jgi:hypothetical protein